MISVKEKVIITIGRQYASGGREIGKKLSERLGIKYYDKEMLTKAAKDSGISEEIFDTFDEKKTTSLLYTLSMGGYGLTSDDAKPLALKVYLAQFDAIKNIAKEGSAVIVGRCADYILKDNANLFSIFVSADKEDRTERTVKEFSITHSKAKSIINKYDKARESYYNYHTDNKWGEASTYDLCINTSKISIDDAVDLICDYIEKRK